MNSTTGGNSRLAGNAARNCASGCARRAQTGRSPSQTPIGTQSRLASTISTTTRTSVNRPSADRLPQVAPAQVGGDEADDLRQRPGEHRDEHHEPDHIDQARRSRAARRPGAARTPARRPPSAETRIADGIGQPAQQPRPPHQPQQPGIGGGRARGGLEAELRRPGDQRAEQQLVVRQDHQPAWRRWRSSTARMSRCSSASAT